MLLYRSFLYPLKAAFLGGFRLGGSPGIMLYIYNAVYFFHVPRGLSLGFVFVVELSELLSDHRGLIHLVQTLQVTRQNVHNVRVVLHLKKNDSKSKRLVKYYIILLSCLPLLTSQKRYAVYSNFSDTSNVIF